MMHVRHGGAADGLCNAIGLGGNAQVEGNFTLSADLKNFWAHWKYNLDDPGCEDTYLEGGEGVVVPFLYSEVRPYSAGCFVYHVSCHKPGVGRVV